MTGLGGLAPTGVGPPLRASLPGDGQHGPRDGTRGNVAMQTTPPQARSPGRRVLQETRTLDSPERRDVLQQVQVRLSAREREVLQQICRNNDKPSKCSESGTAFLEVLNLWNDTC